MHQSNPNPTKGTLAVLIETQLCHRDAIQQVEVRVGVLTLTLIGVLTLTLTLTLTHSEGVS